ncbi:MAG: helix-hairpin-helix domain-containing protein [Chloroflexota bacterium]|nr:helix-hairpin-helix domain-containing protein [Chloroflexota bacterium]
MANTSEHEQPADGQSVTGESPRPSRVYRWVGLVLAPAAVALALLTPGALPGFASPPAVQPPLGIEVSAAALQWINTASADALADQVTGIGPLYAERITTHRRLFGPITEAQTLVDLGIPARVVEQFRSQVPVDP